MATKKALKALSAAPSGGVVNDAAIKAAEQTADQLPVGADAVRMRKAFELRKAGLTYEEIAERVGYSSRSGAYMAVKALLKRSELESVKEMRQIHEARLNDMLTVAYRDALQGDIQAMRMTIEIMERQAALHGLDTPVTEAAHDVIILGGDSEEFVQAIQAALKRQELGAGSIDAESWEDE